MARFLLACSFSAAMALSAMMMVSGNASEKARAADIFAAIATLPRDGSVKKVYHCETETGAYLLYARPDLKFIDIADSDALRRFAPEQAEARRSLTRGKIAFPLSLIRNDFQGDAVLCADLRVKTALETDPHFMRRYPSLSLEEAEERRQRMFAYVLESSVLPNFVNDFSVASAMQPSAPKNGFNDVHWVPASGTAIGEKERSPAAERSPYLSPAKSLAQTEKRLGPCAFFRPRMNTALFNGDRRLLGVGGFQDLRVYLNGKELFEKTVPESAGRSLRYLVRLPHPLHDNDQLVGVACGDSIARVGFSLSLWSENEIKARCSNKSVSTSDAPGSKTETTCLGDIIPSAG